MTVELGEFNVNYQGIEANQIFMEPIFFDEDITANFRVMPNVVTRKKMSFAQRLEKIVRKHSGCGFDPIKGIKVYDRTVQVDRAKIDLELCVDEFLDTVFEELLQRGTSIHDVTGTLLEDIMIEVIQGALKLDLQRLYFFGNKAAADPAYDMVDGLYTVHIPQLVGDNLIPYHNTGSGVALTAGQGINIVRTVYDNSPLHLKALPKNMKRFWVTGSVYERFVEDIEAGGGGDFGLMAMVNGIETPTFRGVPVVAQWRWDDILANDFGTTLPHVCLHTSPSNMVIAADLVNPGDDFQIWYDMKEEKIFVKSRWKMGTNYVHHQLMSVGY